MRDCFSLQLNCSSASPFALRFSSQHDFFPEIFYVLSGLVRVSRLSSSFLFSQSFIFGGPLPRKKKEKKEKNLFRAAFSRALRGFILVPEFKSSRELVHYLQKSERERKLYARTLKLFIKYLLLIWSAVKNPSTKREVKKYMRNNRIIELLCRESQLQTQQPKGKKNNKMEETKERVKNIERFLNLNIFLVSIPVGFSSRV